MTALMLLLALGEQFLTRDEALKLVFPRAEAVVERTVDLDPDVRARVEERYGGPVAPRQQVYVGIEKGASAGYAMILTEITKTLAATFIVGVSPEGEVTEVAVLSHEDHIGVDCKRERFVEQFRGKTVQNRITVPNGGILHVSGATLSCQAVARAVRKAVSIVQYHYVDHPEAAKAAAQEDLVRRKRYLMGTFCTITSAGDAETVEKAFGAIGALEKALSNYDEKSELSRLNREGSLKASPDLLEFVRESMRYSEKTGGAFDVTVAPLVRLWGFKDGSHRVPPDEELRAALGRVGSSRIRIEGEVVTLPPGMELDPGAIGKGMAVDRAARVLREAGVKRALVDFGSSVAAIGTWEIAIRDPASAERSLGTVVITDESLSSSGGYEKFFKVGDETYGHILDPRTGRPARALAAVSVVAPTGAESDAMGTGVYVRGELPEALPALLVLPSGEVRMNDAFRCKLKKGGE